MEISITGKYRSLEPMTWDNIPELAIICGVNGAGKSHLLEEIAHSFLTRKNRPKSGASVNQFTALASEVVYLKSDWDLDTSGPKEVDWLSRQRERLISNYNNRRNGSLTRDDDLYSRLEARTGVERGQLSDSQISSRVKDEELISAAPGTLELVGQLFAKAKSDFIQDKLQDRTPNLENAPWKTLNGLLEAAGLPYRCNIPDLTSLASPFVLEFAHEKNGSVVQPADMSSGERVILKLFLLLFARNFSTQLPRLLILDEPDAHLHPAMVQRFVSTLSNVLVKQHGTRVIMTTHSPTTVAVCPEESLFEMQPLGAPGERIRPISRDRAIGLLTTGVPALRVLTENRRQVFVESEADESILSALALQLANQLDRTISLSFIASGRTDKQDGTGCDRVKTLVSRLNQEGNDSVYGIVDWDGSNKPDGNTRVLAHSKRYAIENCVLDPVVVVAFLIKKQILKADGVGLDEFPTFLNLPSLADNKWQVLVDHVVSRVHEKAKATAEALTNAGAQRKALEELQSKQRQKTTPIQGPIVEFDEWWINIQGHHLEEYLLDTYPPLRTFTGKAGGLLVQVVEHIGAELPLLFPQEIVDVFKEIQGSPS